MALKGSAVEDIILRLCQDHPDVSLLTGLAL
jgi:hypothetical protein